VPHRHPNVLVNELTNVLMGRTPPSRASGKPIRLVLAATPRTGALKAWRARVRDGADPGDIMDGLERYHTYLKATDRTGTEYVMQAATFLGPDKRWTEDWAPTKNGGNPLLMSAAELRAREASHGR
jgi:hypothetical protein